MKALRALFVKDLRLLLRNRLFLVVLIIYPFIITAVIGAAFYDVGRPVPLGLVNLDHVAEGEAAWMGGNAERPSAVRRGLRYLADSLRGYERIDQALDSLLGGEVDVILYTEEREGEGGEWVGGKIPEGEIEEVLAVLEERAGPLVGFADEEGAESSLSEKEVNVLAAVRGEDLPWVGEVLWIDDTAYDAAALMEKFAGDVAEIRVYPGELQAEEDLREGRVDAVIILPRGFVHRLKTLEEIARVRVLLDQSNLVKAEFAETSIRGFLSRINQAVVESKMQAVVAGLRVLVTGGDFFGTEVVGLEQLREDLYRIREALQDRPDLVEPVQVGIDLADTVIEDVEDAAEYLRATALPIELEITSVAGRTLSAKDAVIPALIALSILWTGILCGAILMVVEDEEGMRVRLGMTGTGPLALLGSKLALAAAVVFLQSAVMLFLAVLILGTFASNIPSALLIIALASVSSIGIGLLVAAYARQVAGAMILSVLVTFPMIFICGAVFPLSSMPAFMQVLARAVPVTYAVEALSGVMLRGESLGGVTPQLIALAAFGAVLLFLGSLLARRREGG